MSQRVAQAIQKAAGLPNGMRTATVTAVSGRSVTLSVAGSPINQGIGLLKSYTPAVGDTVAVFKQDSSWLVLGAIG